MMTIMSDIVEDVMEGLRTRNLTMSLTFTVAVGKLPWDTSSAPAACRASGKCFARCFASVSEQLLTSLWQPHCANSNGVHLHGLRTQMGAEGCLRTAVTA